MPVLGVGVAGRRGERAGAASAARTGGGDGPPLPVMSCTADAVRDRASPDAVHSPVGCAVRDQEPSSMRSIDADGSDARRITASVALVGGVRSTNSIGHVVQVDGDSRAAPSSSSISASAPAAGPGRARRAGDAVSVAAHGLDAPASSAPWWPTASRRRTGAATGRPRPSTGRPGRKTRPSPVSLFSNARAVSPGVDQARGGGPVSAVSYCPPRLLLLPAERDVGVLAGERDPQPVEADRAEALVHRVSRDGASV